MPETYRVCIPDLCDVGGQTYAQACWLVNWHLKQHPPPHGYVYQTVRDARWPGRSSLRERIFRAVGTGAVLAQIMREG